MRHGLLTCVLAPQLMVPWTSAHGRSPQDDPSAQPPRDTSIVALAPNTMTAFAAANAYPLTTTLQDADETPSAGFVNIRPLIWLPQIEGDVSLQNVFDLATSLDFEADLGVSDFETIFLGELNFNLGRHNFRVSGFSLASAGRQLADQVITFGDLTIPLGDLIRTDIDLDNITVQYGFSLFSIEDNGFQLGTMAGVDYYHLAASLLVEGTSLQDTIDEHIPIPTAGIHFELPIDDFLISADVAGLYISIQDIDVSFIDASATIGWRPINTFGVFAGYRFIGLDATNGTFDFDATLSGPFVGGEIRF